MSIYDEDSKTPENRPPSPAKLSQTPSWVMLGFILGALCVWFLPAKNPPKLSAPAVAKQPVTATTAGTKTVLRAAAAPRRFTDIEAVFAAYGEFAVWDNNRTEVALWNSATISFSDFFEVLRDGETLYFRSIPALTRPLLAHGSKTDIPLIFTETEEMRKRWIETRSQLVPGVAVPPQ